MLGTDASAEAGPSAQPEEDLSAAAPESPSEEAAPASASEEETPASSAAGEADSATDAGASEAVAAAEKVKVERRDIPADRKGDLLLQNCPVCQTGQVFGDRQSRGEPRYLCDSCESVLKETIFGFTYETLDRRFTKACEALSGQTLTQPDLAALVAKPKPKAEAPEAEPAEAEADAAEASSEPETAPPSGELFWEIDEEAMAERRKKEDERKQGGVTVDDLLEELSEDG